MPDRYAIREEPPRSWTVYDVFTGGPVVLSETKMVRLSIEEAGEVAELLNLQDAVRRGQADLAKRRSRLHHYPSKRGPSAANDRGRPQGSRLSLLRLFGLR